MLKMSLTFCGGGVEFAIPGDLSDDGMIFDSIAIRKKRERTMNIFVIIMRSN